MEWQIKWYAHLLLVGSMVLAFGGTLSLMMAAVPDRRAVATSTRAAEKSLLGKPTVTGCVEPSPPLVGSAAGAQGAVVRHHASER